MKKILTLALIFTLVTVTNEVEYDYFTLALQWSPALCRDENCVKNKIVDKFTIHGLWPSNRYRLSPTFCKETTFDVFKLGDKLADALDDAWPSFTGSNNWFWTNEWKKHGVCSNMDVRSYFSLALNKYRQYDVFKALKSDGIIPGPFNFYTTRKVVKAIKDAFGFEPTLVCRETMSGNEELKEIQLCFDKQNINLVDCQDNHKCPTVFLWRP